MSILCDCVHCASDGRVEEGVQSDLKQADMVYFKPLVDESKNWQTVCSLLSALFVGWRCASFFLSKCRSSLRAKTHDKRAIIADQMFTNKALSMAFYSSW